MGQIAINAIGIYTHAGIGDTSIGDTSLQIHLDPGSGPPALLDLLLEATAFVSPAPDVTRA